MKLFEATFREGFDFYERVFDSNLNKSVKLKIDNKYEWFEESSIGTYRAVLDNNIKLKKVIASNAKVGRDQYGFLDPMYKNIRDNYWNVADGYNKKPRVFYIDIETRSGASFKHEVDEDKVIKIRQKK